MNCSFNSDIFREYDIRGIAEKDLTSPVIEALGRAFAGYLQPKGIGAVTVGYDARLSSPRLCDAIVQGLTSEGMNVTVLGLCPTPALYFSLFHLKPGAGVMITGSHNPAEFNGFKLCVGTDTIYGEEIQKIRRTMEREAADSSLLIAQNEATTSYEPRAARAGDLTHRPILPDYIDYLKNQFPALPNAPLKVVLDAGNGTAGLAAPEIIKAMGCDVIELFSDPDGRFPNHHPDPTIPKNLAALIDTVHSKKADAGIAFDGDSDRIGVVDEKGNILWGDQLMIIFSRDILQERPNATIVSEVKCSQVMYDDIRVHGGTAVMWKTGHSLIKAKLKELTALLAGEMSGHLFFADRYFGYDDAIYAACRLVEILKKLKSSRGTSATLSTLLADLPKTFNTPEIRFDCPDAIKFKVVEKAKEIFSKGQDMPEQPKEVITVDGVRAIFNNGWGLIRASNTQPVLVMRFEAKDTAALETIKTMMEQKVNAIISSLQ
ncbi:MAG: phosphomannomutase/phosphoglucomutase [Betaproteobacteria bacterium]